MPSFSKFNLTDEVHLEMVALNLLFFVAIKKIPAAQPFSSKLHLARKSTILTGS